MKAVVQRVTKAKVTPGGEIGPGLCVLLGVARGDTAAEAAALAGKIARLRIFERDGRFDRLAARHRRRRPRRLAVHAPRRHRRRKGTRPTSPTAAPPEEAEPLYDHFCAALRDLGVQVATGVFGARMELELVNDGPVTIVLDVDASASCKDGR